MSKLDLNWLDVDERGVARTITDRPIEDYERAEPDEFPSAPPNTRSYPHEVEVCFKPHMDLLRFIAGSDAIVGCVAWLTDDDVLKELAKKEAVSVVVQKEDFLRPDGKPKKGWERRLRRLYDAIPGGFYRDEVTFGYTDLSIRAMNGDQSIAGVRCCGIAKEECGSQPRMHHKFFVSMKQSIGHSRDYHWWYPDAVFTGSFNPTRNGRHSLENAVVIRGGFDPASLDRNEGQRGKIHPSAQLAIETCAPLAYLIEWGHVLALSEPLDWQSTWIAPEWRMGT